MSESDNNGSGIEDTGDTGTDAPAQDAAPAADVVPPPAAAPQTFDADPGGKGDDIPSGPDAGSELHEEEDTRGDVPDTARHAAETATRGAAETGGPEAKAAGDDKGGKDTGAEAKDDAPEADAAPAPGTTGSSGTLNHGDEVSIDHDVRPGSSDDHGPAAATAGSGGETAGSGTAATTAETDDHGPAEPASEPADTGRPEAANKEPAAEDATTDGTEAAGDAADATAGGGTETGGPEADDHDDGTPGADGRDDAPADHEQVEDEDGAGGSEAGGDAEVEEPGGDGDKTRNGDEQHVELTQDLIDGLHDAGMPGSETTKLVSDQYPNLLFRAPAVGNGREGDIADIRADYESYGDIETEDVTVVPFKVDRGEDGSLYVTAHMVDGEPLTDAMSRDPSIAPVYDHVAANNIDRVTDVREHGGTFPDDTIGPAQYMYGKLAGTDDDPKVMYVDIDPTGEFFVKQDTEQVTFAHLYGAASTAREILDTEKLHPDIHLPESRAALERQLTNVERSATTEDDQSIIRDIRQGMSGSDTEPIQRILER